jgi:hypothetical protein
VRFRFGTQTITKPVTVVANPSVAILAEDLKKQFELLRDLRDRLTEAHRTVRQIRDVRAQVKSVLARARDLGKAGALEDRARALDDELAAIERRLVNPDIKSGQDVLNYPPALDHQIVGIATAVSSSDAAPTDASYAYFKEVQAKLADVMAALRGVYDKDLAAFNQAVRDQGIPPVVVGKQ